MSSAYYCEYIFFQQSKLEGKMIQMRVNYLLDYLFILVCSI